MEISRVKSNVALLMARSKSSRDESIAHRVEERRRDTKFAQVTMAAIRLSAERPTRHR
jgi:hypothetical protein